MYKPLCLPVTKQTTYKTLKHLENQNEYHIYYGYILNHILLAHSILKQ